MAGDHSSGKGLDRRAAALSFLVMLGLAVPFIPVPGDHVTRIAVQFRTAEMTAPASFTARTKNSICRVLAVVLAYEDPTEGGYTRIVCGRSSTGAGQQTNSSPRNRVSRGA